MTWIEDLTQCRYFPFEAACLVAVGWLGRGNPFPVGQVEPRVYSALLELSKDPWQPVAALGRHGCDLCIYQPGESGNANIFIPGNGAIYVCPELITHYMNAHAYKPPSAFCDAVLACPPMRSMPYLQAILASGGREVVRAARSPATT